MSQLCILYVVSALMDLSVSAATFAVGRRAAELGANALQLGLLGSVWLGVYSVCTPYAGRFSDRVGRRPLAMIGSLIAALATLACAWMTDVGILLALTSVMGVGVGIYWPPIIAWVGGALTGRALAARMARFSIAWNVGMLAGYGLSGRLFEIGPRLAFFLAAGGMFLIATMLLVAAQEESGTRRNRSPQGDHGERPVEGRRRSGERLLPQTSPDERAQENLPRIPPGRGFRKTAWLSNFSMLFAVGGTLALFPQLATTSGIRAEMHGFVLLLHRLAALGVVLILPHLHFWQTRLWPLWIAQAICAVGVAAIGLGSGTLWFCLALMLCGAMLGYNYQASILFTFEEMAEKGKGSGIHEAMLGLGSFFGPILAGWVGQQWNSSMRTPYWFCAAVLTGFIVVEMALVAWRRARAQG